jgi:ubiquinone/menaquinone biosynthesis C-methylase UbiE
VVKGVRSAYDRIADDYAAVNSGAMPEALLRLARKLLADVGLGARILDVGCGVGRDMGWFELHGVRMVGVDLSPAMLSQARRLTASPLILMDMRHLAFRDGSFDGAWCCASLLHLPKAEAPGALGAIRQVLKPGGMLMVSVQEGDCEAWEGGYVEGVTRFFARYRRAGMGAMLEEAGFSVGEVDLERGHRDWLSFVCTAS